jgi:uncharacterized protein YbjT (DUF2867 family)
MGSMSLLIALTGATGFIGQYLLQAADQHAGASHERRDR